MRALQRVIELSLLAASSPGFALPQDDDGVRMGDKVEYEFRDHPINDMGIAGLSDLLGKPVLLDFWGHK